MSEQEAQPTQAGAEEREAPANTLFRRVFYSTISFIVWCLCKVVFRIRSIDPRNVPKHGPVLLVANHESFLDPPVIGVLLHHRHLDFLARASLFKSKIFGGAISALNAVPLKDGSGDMGAIKEILRRLDAGRAVLVFPEGSRTDDGKMQPFKRGIALMVKRAKCPVLPVAISGAFERWPQHARPRLTGRRVVVKYGKPISHDDLMKDGADAALDRLWKEVAALKADIDRGQ